MALWLIPMVYVGVALCFGIVFLRFEHEHLSQHAVLLSQWFFNDFSIASAQACLGAIASGMIGLTAIVFTVAYITAQFNSVAYSPRVASFFIRKPTLFHTFGLFNATFIYSLMTLGWVDRENSHIVPELSMLIVVMVIASMVASARLVRGVSDLLVTNTLHAVGDRGRAVLRQTFDRLETPSTLKQEKTHERDLRSSPVTQTLKYLGTPRAIAAIDQKFLVDLARRFEALIELDFAV